MEKTLNHKNPCKQVHIDLNTPGKGKARWASPMLVVYGSVKELTHGGPPGTGDSGAGSLTESPNFS